MCLCLCLFLRGRGVISLVSLEFIEINPQAWCTLYVPFPFTRSSILCCVHVRICRNIFHTNWSNLRKSVHCTYYVVLLFQNSITLNTIWWILWFNSWLFGAAILWWTYGFIMSWFFLDTLYLTPHRPRALACCAGRGRSRSPPAGCPGPPPTTCLIKPYQKLMLLFVFWKRFTACILWYR